MICFAVTDGDGVRAGRVIDESRPFDRPRAIINRIGEMTEDLAVLSESDETQLDDVKRSSEALPQLDPDGLSCERSSKTDLLETIDAETAAFQGHGWLAE